MSRSHYPGFDVMSQVDAWDPHTQSVVTERQKDPPRPKFLTANEAELLRTIAGHLLYENRDEALSFVVSHFDHRLNSKVGESQRKPQVPPEDDLVRWGLAAFDAVAAHQYGHSFLQCDTQQQFELISQLQRGKWQLEALPKHALLPQKALFKKLLDLAVEAHASHPTVWSEIGYAGPAYPRGYYRLERGLTDPWEPRRNGNGARVE